MSDWVIDNVVVAGVPYTVSVAAVNMAGTGRFIVTVVFTRELGKVFHSYLSYICCYLYHIRYTLYRTKYITKEYQGGEDLW